MARATSSKRLLTTYRRKRDFSKTAEPSGTEETNTGHSFVVQKHAASHLHYDFRLEMDGVLKSWAVAKGPSIDPAVKRLAIEVEDHPLAYGGFEGTIPKGQYGGGTVMLWDRGTWQATEDPHTGYRAGRMKFRLNGSKMKGLWALVRMKPRPNDRNPNWLLIKDKDKEAAPGNPDKLLKKDRSVKSDREMAEIGAGDDVWQSNRAPKAEKAVRKSRAKATKKRAQKMPDFVPPELATRVDHPPLEENWLHEIKFDGYRLHARIDAGDVKLLTRHGGDWTNKFGSLTEALRALDVESAYLDGEAVVLNAHGISDFGALQNWFKSPHGQQVIYYAFDLLYLDGEDLREESLSARKERLQALLGKSNGLIRYSDHQSGSGPAFFKASASLDVEGIVCKRAESTYVSGRVGDWLKVKRIERQEFVVGGYTMSTTGQPAIGALLLGEYKDGKLIYVGKVGTGYSAADAKSLFQKLSKLDENAPSFVKVPGEVRRTASWTKPKLVVEIEFGTWTHDHILRHAAFMGLREDKEPRDVKTERTMLVEKVTHPAAKAKAAKRHVAGSKAKDGSDVLGVAISHPDRLIYPKEKISKVDVAEYYEAVASVMLPYVANRPLSLVRCPDGVGPACFFQKHAGSGGLPEHIEEHKIGNGKADTVLTINSPEGLVALVQRGVIEVHVWGSRLVDVEHPDLIVFDFDPDPSVKWKKVVVAGFAMRDFLKTLKLTSFVKTTGGKGLHVVVPLKPNLDWDGIKQFTRLVASRFAAEDEAAYLINMSKKQRRGKIFVDYLRNGRGATAVAPYSTRARPGATIATPLSWQELEDGAVPQDFTIATVTERIGKRFKDPWKIMLATKQEITVAMIEALS